LVCVRVYAYGNGHGCLRAAAVDGDKHSHTRILAGGGDKLDIINSQAVGQADGAVLRSLPN
jgi:hypothetical protein